MTRRAIAVLIAVVFAAVGAGAVLIYVRSADARALKGKETRTVLVAAKAIPAGTTGAVMRDEKLVREERYPADTLPDGVLDAIRATEETLVATADVQQGQLIQSSMLGALVNKGSGIAIPIGKLAVDARIQTNSFSPRSLPPGAHVVMFITYSPPDQNKKDTISGNGIVRAPNSKIITRPLFTDVEVISVMTEEPTGDGEGPAAALVPTDDKSDTVTVTLALTQGQAQTLAHATALGGLFNVALRNDSSDVSDDVEVDNSTLFD
jgi:pilus assembly protein CpaB